MAQEHRTENPPFELSWLPEALSPVALRLARVDECVYGIGELASSWSMNNPLQVQQYRRNGRLRVVVTGLRPVPPLVWLLFSEAINHLRAALDNTLWHLTTQAHPDITPKAARKVAMPIHESQAQHQQWARDLVKAGLTSFVAGSPLADRIRSLQPFADQGRGTGISSISPLLASLMGQPVEAAHPLLLLKGYSNDDKHRAIRVAVPRGRHSRLDEPFLGQDAGFREMFVGDVLVETTEGTPVPMETSFTLLVPRPEPFTAVVPPATELAALHKWVATTAVPRLVTGTSQQLPASAVLGDNGMEDRDRLLAGDRATAKDRLDVLMASLWDENERRGWLFPDIIDETAGDLP